jgi:hypothetical protein
VQVPDVLDDSLHLLLLGALDQVVGTRLLVGGDEVRVVDSGQGHHVLHEGAQLLLQVDVQHTSSVHGVRQVHVGDVPSANHKVVGVHLCMKPRALQKK